jgi:hypothetical protein
MLRSSQLLRTRFGEALSPHEAFWVVRARESSQLGNRNEDSRANPTDEELFVRNQIVEGAATDGEHSGGFYAPNEELLIRRDRGPTRTFAFGDIYFRHWRAPWVPKVSSRAACSETWFKDGVVHESRPILSDYGRFSHVIVFAYGLSSELLGSLATSSVLTLEIPKPTIA